MYIPFRVSEYWNHTVYEEPSHFREPHFPSYPPSTFDFHQEPEPSEEEQLVDMLVQETRRKVG